MRVIWTSRVRLLEPTSGDASAASARCRWCSVPSGKENKSYIQRDYFRLSMGRLVEPIVSVCWQRQHIAPASDIGNKRLQLSGTRLPASRRLVQQILLMRLLGRPVIQSQVVTAGGLQSLVTEDLLDVADRAAIEQ